jgi:Zinc knuckle
MLQDETSTMLVASSRYKRTQEEPNQHTLLARASEEVLPDVSPPSDVNETSTMAVVATENADVSKQPNLNTMNEPLVIIGNSAEMTQEELNQHTHLLETAPESWEKANPSDVNAAPVLTVVAAEDADVSNETSQTMPSAATTSTSEFKLGRSRKWRFRHTCQLTDAKSECFRCNGTCFNCHETGHIMANCPKLPKYTVSPFGKIPVTAGSSCKNTQEEPHGQSLPTRTSEQVLLDKAASSDVDDTPNVAVIATENADVCKKKPNLYTIEEPIVMIGSSCKSTREELNQRSLPTRTLQQVPWDKANPSDANGASSRAVVATENGDLFNKISQTMPQGTALESGLGSSQKQKWCCRLQLPNCSESEHPHRNRICFTCHKMGHVTENCPKKKAQDAISSSCTRTVTAGSTCTTTQEEPNLLTETSEQVLSKRTNLFDLNEVSVSPMAVRTIKNVHVSNKMSENMTKGTTSGKRVGFQKGPWCCTCKSPASECMYINGTCLTCHEMGHSSANCPKKNNQEVIRPHGTRRITAGSSWASTQKKMNQQSLQTTKQVLLDKRVPSDVNEASDMAVDGIKNTTVSNKTRQPMLGKGPVKGKTSQISQQKTQLTNHKGVGTPSEADVAVLKPKPVLSKKRSWCHACKRRHAKSECSHRLSGTTTVAAGGCTVPHALLHNWWLHSSPYAPVWLDPFQTMI